MGKSSWVCRRPGTTGWLEADETKPEGRVVWCCVACGESRVGSGNGEVLDTSVAELTGPEQRDFPRRRFAESEELLEEYSRISQNLERSINKLLF